MSVSPPEPANQRDAPGAADPDVDGLWGTPTRVVSWVTVPALIVILGVLKGLSLMRAGWGEPGFLGWIELASTVVFVVVGVVLAWAGFLAYSRISVADTTRFHIVYVVGGAILSAALVVGGVFDGANVRVIMGSFAMLGLWISATQFSPRTAAFRHLRILVESAALAVSAVLAGSAVVSGILALVDVDLPSKVASNYLAGGIVYTVAAAVGCVVFARRLAVTSHQDEPP